MHNWARWFLLLVVAPRARALLPPLWAYETGFSFSLAPLSSAGLIVAFSGDATVYGVSAATGTLAWSFPTNSSGATVTPPMLSLNTVVLSTPLFLYSLDASSGAVRWQLERGEGGNGNGNMVALAVAPATGAIYTSLGGAGDCISSLDGATGAVQWTYGCYVGPSGWQDTAGTAVASASGSLFFVTARYSVLVALSASGGLLWNRTLSTSNNLDLQLSPPALSPDGATLYLGTYNSYEANSLLALDAATGATLWTFRCARGVGTAPLVSGAGVAFVGIDGILYSLSSAGQKLWAARLSDLVCYPYYGGSTPVAAPNGTLFAVSSSGDLFSFDGATGSRTALAVSGASCVIAPVASPVVAGEGLFLGSLDARLYKYAL